MFWSRFVLFWARNPCNRRNNGSEEPHPYVELGTFSTCFLVDVRGANPGMLLCSIWNFLFVLRFNTWWSNRISVPSKLCVIIWQSGPSEEMSVRYYVYDAVIIFGCGDTIIFLQCCDSSTIMYRFGLHFDMIWWFVPGYYFYNALVVWCICGVVTIGSSYVFQVMGC